ncbi:MAG: hypothetical protein KGL78_11390 [Burkholderiales bacterium]|nr:hypothetical protein [Burkholderiales bacterium]
MDKPQAEAVAQALLEPHRIAMEEARRKRTADALRVRRRRRTTWHIVIGSALGSALAVLANAHLGTGLSWGGIVGALLGWIVGRWRSRSDPG